MINLNIVSIRKIISTQLKKFLILDRIWVFLHVRPKFCKIWGYSYERTGLRCDWLLVWLRFQFFSSSGPSLKLHFQMKNLETELAKKVVMKAWVYIFLNGWREKRLEIVLNDANDRRWSTAFSTEVIVKLFFFFTDYSSSKMRYLLYLKQSCYGEEAVTFLDVLKVLDHLWPVKISIFILTYSRCTAIQAHEIFCIWN